MYLLQRDQSTALKQDQNSIAHFIYNSIIAHSKNITYITVLLFIASFFVFACCLIFIKIQKRHVSGIA